VKRTYAPDPRPAKRIVDTSVKKALSAWCCRLCGDPNTTAHHLVPRSLGGDDVVSNLVLLCGSGTTGCHGLVEAHDPQALAQLRARLTDAELRYAIAKKGEAWLERYLPSTRRTEPSE
jgi:5-methylcytosine-specific restriction endonuclease McrA